MDGLPVSARVGQSNKQLSIPPHHSNQSGSGLLISTLCRKPFHGSFAAATREASCPDPPLRIILNSRGNKKKIKLRQDCCQLYNSFQEHHE